MTASQYPDQHYPASIAERVAELVESGDTRGALELLQREGDPAAQADARAALGGERKAGQCARYVMIGALLALAMFPALTQAATKPSAIRAAVAVFAPIAQAHWKQDISSPGQLPPLTIVCSGPSSRIECSATSPALWQGNTPESIVLEANGDWLVARARLTYSHGRIVGAA